MTEPRSTDHLYDTRLTLKDQPHNAALCSRCIEIFEADEETDRALTVFGISNAPHCEVCGWLSRAQLLAQRLRGGNR